MVSQILAVPREVHEAVSLGCCIFEVSPLVPFDRPLRRMHVVFGEAVLDWKLAGGDALVNLHLHDPNFMTSARQKMHQVEYGLTESRPTMVD